VDLSQLPSCPTGGSGGGPPVLVGRDVQHGATTEAVERHEELVADGHDWLVMTGVGPAGAALLAGALLLGGALLLSGAVVVVVVVGCADDDEASDAGCDAAGGVEAFATRAGS
jgi:hypothetical protein